MTPARSVIQDLRLSFRENILQMAMPEVYAFPVLVVHVARMSTSRPIMGRPKSEKTTARSKLPADSDRNAPMSRAPMPAGSTPTTQDKTVSLRLLQ